MSLFVYPGGLSPRIPLIEALRESHEHYRAAILARIRKREAAGAPLDSDTDFAELARALAAADGDAAAKVASRVLAETARHALRDPGEYVEQPLHSGVELVFVALAEEQRETLLAEIMAAERAERVAEKAEDDVSARLAARGVGRARARFVAASVHEVISGSEVLRPGADSYALSVLEASGLLVDIFVAARDYQALSLGKGGRFGRPPQPA